MSKTHTAIIAKELGDFINIDILEDIPKDISHETAKNNSGDNAAGYGDGDGYWVGKS